MKILLFTVIALVALIFAVHIPLSYRNYNVILITIDTLRPDYLSCYNRMAGSTPNIDRIARKGVLFTNAYTLIPITMPSHTSILSSRNPYKLKLFNNGDRFDGSVPLITNLLSKKDYISGAFVSLGVLGGAFGLAPHFDRYDDNFEHTNGRFYKVASEMNAVAVPWIEKEHQRKDRFFAWIHYSDPHEPYITVDAPPDTEVFINKVPFTRLCLGKKEKHKLNFIAHSGENQIEFRPLVAVESPKIQAADSKRYIDRNVFVSPVQDMHIDYDDHWLDVKLSTGLQAHYFDQAAVLKLTNNDTKPREVVLAFSGGVWQQRAEEVRKNYAAEVHYVDKYIGILWNKLSELGMLRNTIIIVTADHGEGLKTHGILGHVDKLWNETLHIPLIIYYPVLGQRGKRVDQLVNLLDIMPTVLDLLHIKNRNIMEGQSLKHYLSWSPIDWMFSRPVRRRWTFGYTFTPEAHHNGYALTDGKIKVIHTPTKRLWPWEAYDLTQDPIEKRNLAKVDVDRFNKLSALRGLLEVNRHEAEAAHERRKNPELTEEEKQALHNLGYVAGEDNNQ